MSTLTDLGKCLSLTVIDCQMKDEWNVSFHPLDTLIITASMFNSEKVFVGWTMDNLHLNMSPLTELGKCEDGKLSSNDASTWRRHNKVPWCNHLWNALHNLQLSFKSTSKFRPFLLKFFTKSTATKKSCFEWNRLCHSSDLSWKYCYSHAN